MKEHLKDVKIIMHKEYDHELYKWQNRKRYVKEDDKKYRNKRLRRRMKMMKYQILSCILYYIFLNQLKGGFK